VSIGKSEPGRRPVAYTSSETRSCERLVEGKTLREICDGVGQ
jgi:hypothetical protein